MQKRRLGRTDIEITPVGLGCWQFSQGANWMSRVWDTVPQETITAIIDTALKGGMNWFDTAESYGSGRSEQMLSAALSKLGVRPGSVVVATKWFPIFRTSRSIPATIDTRVACLGSYPIDLYQIHQPWSFSPIPAQMREMAKLLRAGKIRSIGVSNFSARQMESAHAALASEGIVLASNQVRFNLLDRGIERNGLLEAAKRLGITIIAWSPLAQGALTGRFHEDPSLVQKLPPMRKIMGGISASGVARSRPLIDELRLIARAHGISVAQAALAWTVSFHGEAVVAIPGATKAAQAEQSAGSMGVRLTDKELAKIDELSRAAGKR
ncbi:MAG: aldo/keto reductase [Spirochaetia bacterium]|jgi:aryl-alcohol dehydrogenase-like predicted oxidoreductase